MELQIALDIPDIGFALDVVKEVEGVVDIIEIGTPMIVKYGVGAVEEMRKNFPASTILADVKIADGGYLEAKTAVDAGADIVTVLGVSENDTILGVRKACWESGKKIFVDMISVQELAGRSAELDALGVDIIGVHTPFDVQHTGRTPIEDLKVIKSSVRKSLVAIAGGVNLTTIGTARELGADIAIVGGALTGCKTSRREMAIKLKTYC